MPNEKGQVIAEGQVSVKTILVVEDDIATGAFLEKMIAQETFHQALLFPDGLRALEFIQTFHVKPDLLLLDYHLPGMDGIELYDHLHAMKGLEATPGIIISAYLPTSELAKRSLVGMNKPFELNQLLDTVEAFLA